MKTEVAVVIPFYKTELNHDEVFSLKQCFKVLGKHVIIIIKPLSLELPKQLDPTPVNQVISFEEKYFKDIQGYNELMLSTIFYQTFLNYEYILIYQLDAFVFSDQLLYWCGKKYDYIGAPWLYPTFELSWFSRTLLDLKSFLYRRYNKKSKNGLPKPKQFLKQVGNGGLSLRRTQAFYDLSLTFSELATAYIKEERLEFNEDIFWSIAINRKKRLLKVPPYKTALKFSIETCPEIAFKLNQNQLPFGCHAWDKNLNFWKPILQISGYLPEK
jgi:hypothetical protein